jgi:hypothetical protein
MPYESDSDIVMKGLEAKNAMEKGREFLAKSERKVRAMNQEINRKVVHLHQNLEKLNKIGDQDKQAAAQEIAALTGARVARCRECQADISPGARVCSHCGAAKGTGLNKRLF